MITKVKKLLEEKHKRIKHTIVPFFLECDDAVLISFMEAALH